MKLFGFALLAVAAANSEKKVPPRHPSQRLEKLRQFATKFKNQDCLPKQLMSSTEGKNNRMCTRLEEKMHAFAAQMGKSFDRDNCGYYEPDIMGTHGGPDPNPQINPNTGKPRQRRDADFDMHAFDWMITAAEEHCDAVFQVADDGESYCACYHSSVEYSAPSILNNYTGDQDLSTCPSVRGKSSKKDAYDRLSNDTPLKWRQITTGYRKWAERYLSNCSGQRKSQVPKRRAQRMYKNWGIRMGFFSN